MLNIINEDVVFHVSDNHDVDIVKFDDIEILVVDNFYKNPHLVRKLAFDIPATNFTNRNGYPAAQINVSYNMRPVVGIYQYYIQKYFPNCLSDDYIIGIMSQASFMVNVMQSDGNEYLPPHTDCPSFNNLASGIYLNSPEECSGGTSFFKDDEYLGCVDMKYNRMIIYHQNVQHTARMEFNSFVGNTYRINQMFFI
tara:strand:+ start:830 stop:1417 length:588 start_codon:yes stop_codon:yes gene_type:complete